MRYKEHVQKTYIMSDIHGEYSKFKKMLKLINFSESDKLYILGDVIDRGADSIKLLQYIMNSKNITLLLGNHEHLMYETLKFYPVDGSIDGLNLHLWLQNGSESTYSQFIALDVPERHQIIRFISELPLYKIIDNHYFLSHAGLNVEKKLEDQDKDDFIWSREEFYNQKGIEDYFYIFGHTPTSCFGGNNKIWIDDKYKDKMNIDCGACWNGNLACIELYTMKEFYVGDL